MAAAALVALIGTTAALTDESRPEFAQVKTDYRASDQWIVDRQGLPMASIRVAKDRRSLDWVTIEKVSPAFLQLLVQAEDKRFYSHRGVDWRSLAHAIWIHFFAHHRRGGSTLTMQLVNLLHQNTGSHDWRGKLRQIFGAVQLERTWDKSQVLEAYLNLIGFRGEIVGLKAASLGYFGKGPEGLQENEAAILVALLRAPNAGSSVVAKRACQILRLPSCDEITRLSTQVLDHPYRLARDRELLPVLNERFVEESGQGVVRTTLDRELQTLAMAQVREQLLLLQQQQVHDAAVLVLETATGRPLAYVANGGPGLSSSEQVDGVQMLRQAGSTLKPFVYATAIDMNILSGHSLLLDSPADIPVSQGRVYHPRNYDNVFRGLVSVGDALGSSLNVPAVRAIELVGETRVVDRLRALGFRDLQDDGYYGPSLALGAVDISLWDLTQAYRQLAAESPVFKPETRQTVYRLLAAPEYRRHTFGFDSVLNLPFAAAVKTGTSKDMRDNWCVGWTSQFTVGVWVGNFSGAPMWNVSGISGAAPIWRALMLALHPNGSGDELPQYHAPAAPLPAQTISRIRYPAAGMLVGLDPDIPTPMQRLPIEIENPLPGQKVWLNRRLLSRAEATVMWPIQRGRYRLELKDQQGQLLDKVRFEVR